MRIEEARRILGLKPGEEACVHLGEFEAARELIAEMVRCAPNDTIALRYQEGLVEFDRALAALREELERRGERVQAERLVPVPAHEEVAAAPAADHAPGLELPVSGAMPVPQEAEEVEPEVEPCGVRRSLVTGPRVVGPKVSGPEVLGPEVEGPKVRGPEVEGPKVRGPEFGDEDAFGAEFEVQAAEAPAEEAPAAEGLEGGSRLAEEGLAEGSGMVSGGGSAEVPEEGLFDSLAVVEEWHLPPVPLPGLVEPGETWPAPPGASGGGQAAGGVTVGGVAEVAGVAAHVLPGPAVGGEAEARPGLLEPVVPGDLPEGAVPPPLPGAVSRAVTVAGSGPAVANRPGVSSPFLPVAEELPSEPVAVAEELEEELAEDWPAPRRRFPVGAVVLALLVVALGGAWLWLRVQEDLRLQRQARITFLERQGAIMVENRRWEEAARVYRQIDELEPGSPLAAFGRRSIEAGMAEEQSQFLAYWQGEALAAFEAGRWDDAEKAIRTVAAKVPNNAEVQALQARIAEERRLRERREQLDAGRKALEAKRWSEAAEVARRVLDRTPGDRDAGDLLLAANAGRERERENLERARELVAMARERDAGKFDEQALEWVREAARLAPGDPEVSALYQRLSGYTRVIKVPGDHDTIGAAIAAARPKDRIVVGKGVWKESLVVGRVVEIEGAGAEESVIECLAGDGPVAVFEPAASGTRVAGVGFRHVSFAGGSERFSAVVVRGGQVTFENCQFRDASGHGLAVIEGGAGAVTGCRFEGNGWDGAAAYGEESRLEAVESQAVDNFEHGFDVWNGATILARSCLARGNGRNGYCVNTPGELVLDRNKAEANREFGIVVAASEGGKITGNSLARNELGGMALHRGARGLEVRGNTATRNEGPGLVLDEGFAAVALDGNEVSGNRTARQIIEGVKLDAVAETPATGAGTSKK